VLMRGVVVMPLRTSMPYFVLGQTLSDASLPILVLLASLS
jgi:hypothetical protein